MTKKKINEYSIVWARQRLAEDKLVRRRVWVPGVFVGKIGDGDYYQQPGAHDGYSRLWHPTKSEVYARDWEILKDASAGTPTWAMWQLRAGRKIRYPDWNEDWYTSYEANGQLVQHNGAGGSIVCSLSDMGNSHPDWTIYSEVETMTKKQKTDAVVKRLAVETLRLELNHLNDIQRRKFDLVIGLMADQMTKADLVYCLRAACAKLAEEPCDRCAP